MTYLGYYPANIMTRLVRKALKKESRKEANVRMYAKINRRHYRGQIMNPKAYWEAVARYKQEGYQAPKYVKSKLGGLRTMAETSAKRAKVTLPRVKFLEKD